MKKSPIGDRILGLANEIEELKNELDKAYLLYKQHNHKEILDMSKQLDSLIVEYQKLKLGV